MANVLDFTCLSPFWNDSHGYFCTLIRCRLCGIGPGVRNQNFSATGVTLRTCLRKYTTIGKCSAELLTMTSVLEGAPLPT